MWRIALTNAAGDEVDRIVVHAPIEAMRDWCRRSLEERPEAAHAKLVSEDGYLEYAYPEVAS